MARPLDLATTAWVDRQLMEAFEPKAGEEQGAADPERALERLRRESARRSAGRRRRAWAAAGLCAAASFAMTQPQARALASRCIDACVSGGQSAFAALSRAVPEPGRIAAPEFALPDANGTTVRLSDLRGEVVLLNFWATWCPPCLREIPWFIEFQRVHGPRGLRVVGVSLDEDGWARVRPFVARQGMNYPVVLGNDEMVKAFGGVDSVPATLLIDRRGRIAAAHLGLPARTAYERDIARLLEETR